MVQSHPMEKRRSIKDIAKHLGVSKTTVSFVLNGKQGVSEAVKKRILDYVEKVGYRPNHMAQGLRTGKSKTIGMMIEDIADPFFSSIARLVEENAYKKGYRIIYGSTENSTEKTRDLINMFRRYQVDGYIIAPAPGIEADIQTLIAEGLPVVIFDRMLSGIDTSFVEVDNFAGAYKAVDHLMINGFKRIALITLESEQNQMLDRLEGYLQAINDHGLKQYVKKIKYHEDNEKSISQIIAFLQPEKIDAIFFTTNYIAFTGLEALKRLNLQISKDIGIVVFDDYNSFALFGPSITAVAQPIKEIADNLTRIMLKQLSNGFLINPEKVELKTTLMVRGSSMPIKIKI
ncbi:MAG: transcriptional regulator, LacI family [Mucilaginibacter sp.]|nr:transcriptional regulator, LacI family [Mucilaginibacter sp.]